MSTPNRIMIRDLPSDEQPQTRLQRYGPAALNNAELLSIVLGLPDLGQAETLLARYEGLPGLAKASAEQIACQGIGAARARRLKAALELGRRALMVDQDRLRIRSATDAADLLLAEMGLLEQEELRTIILDTRHQVLKIHTVYKGSLNTTLVRVGEVFREAIRLSAAAIIVAHNHPSGDPTPSPEDVQMTREIVKAGRLLDIAVLDHLIIGQQRWISLKERGMGF